MFNSCGKEMHASLGFMVKEFSGIVESQSLLHLLLYRGTV